MMASGIFSAGASGGAGGGMAGEAGAGSGSFAALGKVIENGRFSSFAARRHNQSKGFIPDGQWQRGDDGGGRARGHYAFEPGARWTIRGSYRWRRSATSQQL